MARVTDSPTAARLGTPSWLDGRLVLGVLLVLVSVLVGAKVLAGADSSQQVWSATRDLPAGTVLTSTDLELTKVRLFGSSGRYLAGQAPIGYVVLRGVGGHELLPHDALSAPGSKVQRRHVAVAVAAGHLPGDLQRGDVVDLYVTPDEKAVRRGAKGVDLTVPRLVLSDVLVARVTRSSGLTSASETVPVVLDVEPGQVLAVVQALADGPLDLVRVPDAQLAPLAVATPGT
jgi:hypothetical protein